MGTHLLVVKLVNFRISMHMIRRRPPTPRLRLQLCRSLRTVHLLPSLQRQRRQAQAQERSRQEGNNVRDEVFTLRGDAGGSEPDSDRWVYIKFDVSLSTYPSSHLLDPRQVHMARSFRPSTHLMGSPSCMAAPQGR